MQDHISISTSKIKHIKKWSNALARWPTGVFCTHPCRPASMWRNSKNTTGHESRPCLVGLSQLILQFRGRICIWFHREMFSIGPLFYFILKSNLPPVVKRSFFLMGNFYFGLRLSKKIRPLAMSLPSDQTGLNGGRSPRNRAAIRRGLSFISQHTWWDVLKNSFTSCLPPSIWDETCYSYKWYLGKPRENVENGRQD